jgi:MFS family permease
LIQLLINGILMIWNLFWALLAGFLCDRIGRRVLFLCSAVGMFVFFSCQTICAALFLEKGFKGAAHGVIAFIFLFYASYE